MLTTRRSSLPPIEVLYRIRKQRPDLFDKMEIYIDGGITRGSDVLKALCLGARAVGIGRPFLYSLGAGYGQAGAARVLEILREEIEGNMRILGVTTLDELGPHFVNARALERDIVELQGESLRGVEALRTATRAKL